MPYVITTKRPPTLPSRIPSRGLTGKPNYAVSRRAVATLEEAREAAKRAVIDSPHKSTDEFERISLQAAVERAMYLPAEGGTVSLPDGTVIEVERIGWPELAVDARAGTMPRRVDYAEIIAAYNAEQG